MLFKKQYLLILLFCSFLWGCASPEMPMSAYPPGYAPGTSVTSYGTISYPLQRHDVMHEVGPLETLWRIAKAYDVSVQEIMTANRLSDPNKLEIGQKLLIPSTYGLRPVIPLYHTRPWTYIIIHHTATETGNAIFINRSHKQRGFWGGLGYHFLIDNGTLGKLDGQIEVSPRWVKQEDGAHCNVQGMNQHGIGVALVGNFSQTQVSGRQLDSLVFLVSTLMKHYRIPINRVMRHGDVPGKNTECPGTKFPWKRFMSLLEAELRSS